MRKANTPCFSGKKAEFLSSSPRVESDASRSRVDHAEIERRTLEALEREKYESTRADAEREEALAKKRADLGAHRGGGEGVGGAKAGRGPRVFCSHGTFIFIFHVGN